MSNHLILYTSTNQKGRHDATGAFIPEAKNLHQHLLKTCEHYNVTMAPIKTTGVSLAKRREQVEAALKTGTYDHIYFLCHGYKNGIQFGYKWRSGAVQLANLLHKAGDYEIESVIFYCCSVAKNRDNFCEWIYNELSCLKWNTNEVQVFGHYSAGHTTMNPNIKIYRTGYKPFIWSNTTPQGYNQIVKTDKKEAKEMIRDANSDLRFTMPFYVQAMIDNSYDWGWK